MKTQNYCLNTATDKPNIHPIMYCHKCHTIASKREKGSTVGTAVVPFKWESHGGDWESYEGECWVCKGKGVRQKKGTKKRGRPKDDSGKGVANTVLEIVPTSWKVVLSLSLSRFLPPASFLSLHDLQCKVCSCIVDQPVETLCSNLVCAECISSLLLTVESSLQCPCCKDCLEVSPTMFVPASEVVLKVLGTLLVRCDKSTCTAVVNHREAYCGGTFTGNNAHGCLKVITRTYMCIICV